jgi:hypothetical protein
MFGRFGVHRFHCFRRNWCQIGVSRDCSLGTDLLDLAVKYQIVQNSLPTF